MSGRCGAANQSRERKRRTGVRGASEVKAQLSLRQAGNVGVEGEQAAGERLRLALFHRQPLPGGGGVDGAEVLAAERRLGHVGDREADVLDQLAFRRIAVEAPAAEQAGPDAAL